jgi:hypothetical protein
MHTEVGVQVGRGARARASRDWSRVQEEEGRAGIWELNLD